MIQPEDPISIAPVNPPQAEEGLISLADADIKFVPDTDEKLTSKAYQYDVAFDKDSPGVDELKNQLASNQEDTLRKSLASQEDLKKSQVAQELAFTTVVSGLGEQDPTLVPHLADPGPPTDPTAIVETKFVQNLNDYFMGATENEDIKKVQEETPMQYGPYVGAAEDSAIKSNIINAIEDEYNTYAKNRGWVQFGKEGVYELLYLPSWGNIVSSDPGTEATTAWTVGGALDEKVQNLLALPPAEMSRQVRATYDSLMKFSSLDAGKFVAALKKYSTMDRVLEDLNIVGVVPIGAVTSLPTKAGKILGLTGKAMETAEEAALKAANTAKLIERGEAITGVKLTQEAQDVRQAAQEVNNALTDIVTDPAAVHEQAGDILTASQMMARDAVTEELLGPKTPEAIKRNFATHTLRNMPSSYSTSWYANGRGNTAARRATLLADLTKRSINIAKSMINDTQKVSRVPMEALEQGFQNAERAAQNYFTNVGSYVLDVERIMPEDSPVNVGMISVTLGNPDLTAYTSRMNAQRAAARMGLKANSYTIAPKGAGGFVIKTYKYVEETAPNVWDDMIPLENQPNNGTYPYFKALLSPKISQPVFQTGQRGSVVHGETAFGIMARQLYSPFEALKKGEKKALDKMMEINRMTEAIPGDPTTRGMYYQSLGELESAYMRHMRRLPSDREVAAYFAVKQATDVDFIFRSLNETRRKVSQGHELLSIERIGQKGSKFSVDFEAKEIRDDYSVLNKFDGINIGFIAHDGTANKLDLRVMTKQWREDMIDKLFQGEYKLIQPYNPRDKEVMKLMMSDEPFPYIITPGIKARNPIDLTKQVNYRAGWHNNYKAPYFIKQPRFKKRGDGSLSFEGDTTALAAKTEAHGKEAIQIWEKGRQFVKKGDMLGLSHYLNGKVDMTAQEFANLFTKHLDPNIPLVLVRRGTRSATTNATLANGKTMSEFFGAFDDTLDRFHNPSATFGDNFIAERDPLLLELAVPDESNPLYRLDYAEQFSPMATQVEAMKNLIHSTFYEDYQMAAANSWVSKFWPILKYDGRPLTEDMVRRNPLFYLRNATIDRKHNLTGFTQAQSLRSQILNLVGTPSVTAEGVEYFKQKMLSNLYKVGGDKLVDYVPEKLIPTMNDPYAYFRAVAFHSKLGFFNPVQFFVQASAVTNIALISPVQGVKSTIYSLAMRQLSLTELPSAIDVAGDIVKKLGGDKAKFIESKRLMDGFAFDRVSGEHAFASSIADPTLFRDQLGRVMLDKGTVFFNAGERAVRLTAWNTAYLEWAAKNANKVGKATRADAQAILNRAQKLSANMTRDSSSFWQRGLAGNFTQFWSYNVRMAELMFGRQLSKAERMRLIMGNMLLYGFTPAAGLAGAAIYGDAELAMNAVNPFGEDIQIMAAKKGINLQAGLPGALYKGMFNMAIQALTGEDLDIGARFGMSPIKAFDNIKQNFRENGSARAFVISVMGPSGSIINDMVKGAYPIMGDLIDIVNGDTEVGKSLLLQDLIDAARSVAGVNAYSKVLHVLMAENNRTRRGNLQSANAQTVKEIAKALTGVQDIEETTAYRLIDDAEAHAQTQKEIHDLATKYMAYYYDNVKDRPDVAAEFRRRAIHMIELGNFSPDQKLSIVYPDNAKYEQTIIDTIFDTSIKGYSDEEEQNMRKVFEEQRQ